MYYEITTGCVSLDLTAVCQYWFRQWLGSARQQAITWANVDPDLCHYMASQGSNLISEQYLGNCSL